MPHFLHLYLLALPLACGSGESPGLDSTTAAPGSKSSTADSVTSQMFTLIVSAG